MIKSVSHTINEKHPLILNRLVKLNHLLQIVAVSLIAYMMFDEFNLANPLRFSILMFTQIFLIYLTFWHKWTNTNILMFFIISASCLTAISAVIPELRFEGLFYINLAVQAIILSNEKQWNLIYLLVAFLLTGISLTAELIGWTSDGSFNFVVNRFIVVIFFICDLCFKLYITISSNYLRLQNLIDRNIVNEQYANLFNNSFDPIFLVDSKENRIIECNNSVSKLLGVPNQEIKGKSINEYLALQNLSNEKLIKELEVKSANNDVETTQDIFHGNCVFNHVDSSIRHCLVQVVPLENQEGFVYLVCVDRTEEIEAKQQLEQANQNHRNIFDNNLLGVNSLDAQSIFTQTNHSFCEMLGYGKEALIGKSIIGFVHEDSISEITELFQLLKQGEIHSFIQEIKFNRADNNVLQTLISVRGVYEEEVLTQAICTVQDISQRKEVEQSLIQSESKYRKIFNNSLSGLAIVSNWIFLDINKSLAKILEVDISEIIGKNLLDYVHPDDLEYAKKEGRSLADYPDGQKQIMLKIVVGDKIKRMLISMTENESPYGDYKSIGILNFSDLTELLEMQTKLNERQAIYEALVNSSFTGIDVCEYVYNEETRKSEVKLIFRNKLLSYYLSDLDNENEFISFESLRKITPDRSLDGQTSSKAYNQIVKELINNKKVNFDWSFKCDDGIHDFNVYIRLTQVDGKSLVIRNFLDITEKRKKDKIILNQLYDINKKKDKLEKYIESNLQLENFAYIASHDLKAPLRTVSSFAYLLKKSSYEELNDKGKKYLDIIISSSASMQVLIHDLLQFARINQDKLTIKNIDVRKFFNRCIENINQDIIDSKGKIEFLNIPNTIAADEVKLAQLFQNLIRNGLKFKRSGIDPVIKLNCQEEPSEWIFTVSDNGIGIHDDNREKIFGIFSKLHSEDEFEGTGLGLTISKKIVEKHGGKIWLKSKVNEGTTFYFSIPKPTANNGDMQQFQQSLQDASDSTVSTSMSMPNV